jgi:hypothetical protein
MGMSAPSSALLQQQAPFKIQNSTQSEKNPKLPRIKFEATHLLVTWDGSRPPICSLWQSRAQRAEVFQSPNSIEASCSGTEEMWKALTPF